VLAVTAAHVNTDRVLAMFERLGGAEACTVAERCWTDPNPENLEAWIRVLGPLYAQRPMPPEISARITTRLEVAEHFARGEELTFDLRPRPGEVRCPVLLLAGELDPGCRSRMPRNLQRGFRRIGCGSCAFRTQVTCSPLSNQKLC
jgi:pimeloyl-ACP methyl ester carboxylesterase